MTSFELEWLRTEKEHHARLLHQLRRDLAQHPKIEVTQSQQDDGVEKPSSQTRYGYKPNPRAQRGK